MRGDRRRRPQPTRRLSEPHPPTHHPTPTRPPAGSQQPPAAELTTRRRVFSLGRQTTVDVRSRRPDARAAACRLGAGEPCGAFRRCAQRILKRVRRIQARAARRCLPHATNSVILRRQTRRAALSGRLPSQRPHPDVQREAQMKPDEADFRRLHPSPPIKNRRDK